jgi:O-antigen biosynthesis protein
MKKLKIYNVVSPAADCGVGYYRQMLPLWEMEKRGLIELRTEHFTWGTNGAESGSKPVEFELGVMAKNCEWADVVYWSRNDVPQYIANMGGIREYLWDKTKKYKPMVLDIDDNIFATRPYNPGYRSYYPNSPYSKWNIKAVENFDAITVSTKNLENLYKQHIKDIFVCPNSMPTQEREDLFKKPRNKYPKKEGEIRIGWSGSAAHWENLKHIEKPVIDILSKYPNTTFYYTGLFGDLFQEKSIKDRVVSIPWSNLKTWGDTNYQMNLDIALAPLVDNDFNRAKSNLRILEYATAKYPVIASPVEPYKTFSSNEVLFAVEKEEWFNAIDKLVKSKDKRDKYSEALDKKVKTFYSISKNYKIWLEAFKQIIKIAKSTEKKLINMKH